MNAQSFLEISKDNTLSFEQKEIQLKSLLETFKSNNDLDALVKDTYEIIKWYRKEGHLEKAIALNKKNLKLMDSINYLDMSFYRRNLYSLGFYEMKNNNKDGALNTYKKLLTYNQQDEYVIKGTFQIAEIYFVHEQYHKAIEYYNLCMSFSEELENDLYVVRATLGIGQSCTRINTKKSLDEGIRITSKTIGRVENSELEHLDIRYSFALYKLLGNLYSDRDDYNAEQAEHNLIKALKIAESFTNNTELIKIHNDLGLIYLKEKRPEAETYLLKALSYKPYGKMYSIITRNLADYHLKLGNYNRALEYIQSSLDNLTSIKSYDVTDLPNQDDIIHAKEKLHIVSSLDTKIEIWLELAESNSDSINYYFNQALKTIKLSDYLVDIARIENTEFKSKLFWRKTATDLYIKASRICYKTNRPNDAFYYIEKNKALLLLEDITLKLTRNSSFIPENIVNKEESLKDVIYNLEKLALEKKTDSVQRNLLLAKDKYNTFINTLDANYRLYFKTHKPAEVVGLNEFKNTFLQDNNAYIEYILDEKEGYGLLITKDQTILYEITNCEALKSLAVEYRELLNQPFRNNADIKNYSTISYKIYSSLFTDEIKHFITGKTLTIVPDLYLQNMPFEPLNTSEKDLSYLIYNNEINYAYSLTLLKENKKIRRENTNSIIAFAPIEFQSQLSALQYTKDEVRFIDKALRGKILSRQDASKENFFKKSNNYKIIHVASHANANDSMSPWISFHDGKVNLDEIYNLKNSAELVVLSACNTSLGELYKGEGVMSLSRGFFNSGSHSVMPTLWEVNDKATLSLVTSFYSNLKKGQNKSFALHNAKLNYLESNSLSNSSPYYWASFVLVGDTGSVEITSKLLHYYWIYIILLLLTAFLILFRKKFKR